MSGLLSRIAGRYLRPRRPGRGYAVRSAIAVTGVTLGVAVLVLVSGVMTGMRTELQRGILNSTPHILVLEWRNQLRLANWPGTAERIGSIEGIRASSPFVLTSVVVRTRSGSRNADLYGVPVERDGEDFGDFGSELRARAARLMGSVDSGGIPPVVLGSRLAEALGTAPGDTLVVLSLEQLPEAAARFLSPRIRAFRVAGTLDTGIYDYDLRNLYVPLEAGQALLGLADSSEVSGLGVQVADPWQADRVADEIQDRLGFDYRVITWTDTNRGIFAALTQQKQVMSLVLFLIVVVAAFGIVSTLYMVVEERTAEIGILKSMGMTDRQLLQIFLLQGLWVGIGGALAGGALGLLLAWLQDRFELVRISAEVYLVDRLRATPEPLEVLLIVLLTIGVSLVAAAYPAWRAARLTPVEAIRRD